MDERSIEYLDPFHDPGPDSMYPNLTRKQLEGLVYLLTLGNSPTRRVQRGFARAGIVFGAIPLLIGLATFVNYHIQGWPLEQPTTAYTAAIVIAISAVIYGIFYALGWILAGFFKGS